MLEKSQRCTKGVEGKRPGLHLRDVEDGPNRGRPPYKEVFGENLEPSRGLGQLDVL